MECSDGQHSQTIEATSDGGAGLMSRGGRESALFKNLKLQREETTQ
jgi:hypothetical protein